MNEKERVLVVDDDPEIRGLCEDMLSMHDYDVIVAEDGATALRLLDQTPVDAALVDLKMPGMDGITLMQAMKERDPELVTIMITGYGSIATAVQAMKSGAEDFLTKPVSFDHLAMVIHRALDRKRMQWENRWLRQQLVSTQGVYGLIGQSAGMRQVYELIGKAAGTTCNVLIYGETGSGKELVARAVHAHSGRAKGPFLAINCGAVPEGLLESELFGYEAGAFTGATKSKVGLLEAGGGGTVLLDEIGDMPMGVQVKLLRAIEEKQIRRLGSTAQIPLDVRFICATHRDLEEAVDRGTFRQDLFYRIHVFRISIPPLRDRREDIPVLAEYFLGRLAEQQHTSVRGFSPEAMQRLLEYGYPGNVRELENIVEQAMAFCEGRMILPEHLLLKAPTGADPPLGGPDLRTIAEVESSHIRSVLHAVGGNKSKAAEILGIGRRTLYEKMARYDLN